MKVIAIAAVAQNGVIGNGLELPWDIPEDMRFFRESTKNHVVIMGRKTFDSLKKALPSRVNVVITRDPKWAAPNTRVFHSLGDAIQNLKKEPENKGKHLFVIGGAQIYGESFPFLDELWLTEIQKEYVGDVFFPAYRGGRFTEAGFEKVSETPQTEQTPANDRYFFTRYRKKAR